MGCGVNKLVYSKIFVKVKQLLFRQIFFRFTNKSPVLEKVVLVITYKCNMRCSVCFLWGESSKTSSPPYYFQTPDTDFKFWQKFINQVAPYFPAIILTGGEPLLSPIWDRVAEEIKKKNLTTCLLTNGIKIKENINKIIELVDYLQVSLDGPEAEIHNYSRKDSFSQVVSNLILLHTQKKSLAKSKPYLNIGYTINEKNYNQLINTLEFLNALDIQIQEVIFLHLLFTQASLKNIHMEILKRRSHSNISPLWEGFFYPLNFKKNEIAELKEQFKIIKKRNRKWQNIKKISFIPNLDLDNIEEYYSYPYEIPNKFRRFCVAPWVEVDVMPDGTVFTCPDYIMGNIKEEDFNQIWNGENYKRRRKSLKEEDLLPLCRVCASLYEYGNYRR